MSRGCNLPSICSICLKNMSSWHLFFERPLVMKLWSWFYNVINLVFNFNSLEGMWDIVDRSWPPQCRTVITIALINLLNTIWYVRNQARFNHTTPDSKSTISMIIVASSLSGYSTNKTSKSSINDYTILNSQVVSITPNLMSSKKFFGILLLSIG